MSKQKDIKKEASVNDEKNWRRTERQRQIIGILVGLLIGVILVNIAPTLVDALSPMGTLLWSAAIGGMIGSLRSFEKAGAALTRSDNRLVNLLLALGLVLIFLLLIYWILKR